MGKKNKCILSAISVIIMTAAMSTTTMAGTWKQDAIGWKYQNDDGTYAFNGWQWVDGDYNGIAECYYFDSNGYTLTNTTTPDGYTVNADGAWIDGEVIKTKQLDPHTNRIDVPEVAVNESAVMDGNSIDKITVNAELLDMLYKDSYEDAHVLDTIQNKTFLKDEGDPYYGPVYLTVYRGNPMTIRTFRNDIDLFGNILSSGPYIMSFVGRADQMLDGLPEQGIELDAFYDNCGYEEDYSSVSPNCHAGRRVWASTGDSDETFELATGTYRMAHGEIKVNWPGCTTLGFWIVLTKGTDDKWYIYPDSQMEL